MANIAVLIIMLGCAALLFLKGTVLRAFATIIVAICALIAAFSFFEFLANFIISRADKGSLVSIVNLAQPICFTLVFIIVFAVLQTLAIYLTREEVDLGLWPERIGRAVCGLILGFIVSGVFVTVLAMVPSLPMKLPYERFEAASPKPGDPKKVLFNADGFVTNLFSTVSNGSLSNKRSFSVLHANYLDQIFMNRLPEDTSILTSSTPAITIPSDKAVWPASEAIKTQINELKTSGELKNSPGKPSDSYTPMIVRIGFKRSAVKNEEKVNAGKFTASQLRLICKKSTEMQNPLSGTAVNVFPVGHLRSANQIQVTKEIKLDNNIFNSQSTKDIDFVFCVPSGFTPVLVEFKLNSVAQIRQDAILKDSSDAPTPATFTQRTESESSGGTPGGGAPGNRGGMPGRGGNFGNRGGRGAPGGNRGMRGQQQNGATPEDIAEELTGNIQGI
ncbi:MAG: CvpA family protein [Sedimentisphaerales bacterium]|nr:CvpA family protein [Sedimentisphaerales bacterium]